MNRQAWARLQRLGRPFGWLLLSDALMLLSLMIGHVAVPWWIAQAGGAAHLAGYAGAMALVSFLALPLLSPLGDRVPKRHLIAGGLLLMALEAAVVAGMAQAGHYDIVWLIGLEMLSMVAMAAIMPASFSIVAELLPAGQLTEGLGWQKSAQALGRMAGPALGGAMLALAGTAAALWLHTALLAAACGLATRLPQVAAAPRPQAARWWADLRAGLAAKWQMPMERGWTGVSFLVMLFFTPGIGMLVPLKVQALGLSGAWLGGCEAALSAGMLAGSLGGAVALAQRIGRFRAVVGAIAIEGLCLMLVGWARQPLWLLPAFAGFGLCIAVVQMVGHTHRMLAMPPDFRARMTAVNMMVMQVSGVLGPALAGGALAWATVHQVYLAFGLALALAAWGYRRVPGMREFLNRPHAEVEGLYARRHPELFR